VWPTEIADFRGTLFELYRQLEKLGIGVLRAVARDLALDEDYFSDKVNQGNSILRALHYPPVPASTGGAVRAAAHEDINLITLLIGSPQPGLEVLSQSGQWVKAPGGDDLILCNVGDMLQRLTNHVLSSTTHRVVNPPSPWCDVSRYSLPFFLHPNSDFLIETLPDCVSEMRPNRYPIPITADDYLQERLREIGLIS
jgi:isopenicillin N synthase-like dioxygenase